MADELVQLLDRHGVPTGEVMGKKQVHAEGLYHPCVHFFVTDGQGNLLAQFRGPDCGHMRNVWDPIGAAGHITAPVADESELSNMYRRRVAMSDIDPIAHAFDSGVREANEEFGAGGLTRDILHTPECRYLGITRGDFRTEDGWMDRSFTHNFLLRLPHVEPASCKLEEGKVLEVRWMSIEHEIVPALAGRADLVFANRQPDHQWMLRLACAGAKLMERGH